MSKNLFEYSKAITSNSLALVITSLIGFLSLIAFGWLMASHKDSITILSSLWGWLYKFSQIALGFGTLIAGISAYIGVGEWKRRFVYEKCYDSLNLIKKKNSDLIEKLLDYSKSYDKVYEFSLNKEQPYPEISDKKEIDTLNKKKNELNSAFSVFKGAIDMADLNSISEKDHLQIKSNVHIIINQVELIYCMIDKRYPQSKVQENYHYTKTICDLLYTRINHILHEISS